MNEQLHLTASYLAARARVIRYTPPASIPPGERYVQVENLINELWALASVLGLDLGRKPTIIYTGAPIAPPSVLLGRITALHVESLATFHMTGLAHTLSKGVLLYTSRATNQATPCFRTVIDETFPSDDDDHDFAHTQTPPNE